VVGAEGTLVVATKALVDLVPKPRRTVFAVGHFTSVAAAIAATGDALSCDPAQVELMDKTILDLSRERIEYADLGRSLDGDPAALLFVSFTGDDDPMIGADKVAAFKKEMDAAKANYRVVTYPGTKHSFTNPDADELGKKFKLPLAYNAAADKDSWQQATVFLREIFSGK